MERMSDGSDDTPKLTGQELPGMPNHMVPYARLLDGTIAPDDAADATPQPQPSPKEFVRPRGVFIRSRREQNGRKSRNGGWRNP